MKKHAADPDSRGNGRIRNDDLNQPCSLNFESNRNRKRTLRWERTPSAPLAGTLPRRSHAMDRPGKQPRYRGSPITPCPGVPRQPPQGRGAVRRNRVFQVHDGYDNDVTVNLSRRS